ncbi:hypothetical protein Desdi_0187 [Desulfitobacterium dichloroeliminans LMG P-21439]|uniref:Cytochrome c domain-containing protein n=1 Tax=Desulfitobacterium dichloroeliminans (strain LMG P-21439 / DCA1) TaxID=871963 RepID=L0F3V3_DESDL|nr:hypothetical protein [Desulfitobacterium dichloroeliminans]AGA67745.1 hypothetical protein Desdi_0187 [Desulfitobacterium dichloroeliminans LMG P-21439]
MRNKSRFLLLCTLFIGLSIGVFFSSAATTQAVPEMSPDGVTCTPCHEEGFGGGGEAPAGETPATETPATETPATETPAVETPAVEEPAAEVPEAKEPMSPWIVVGGVIAILGVIYAFAIKKK